MHSFLSSNHSIFAEEAVEDDSDEGATTWTEFEVEVEVFLDVDRVRLGATVEGSCFFLEELRDFGTVPVVVASVAAVFIFISVFIISCLLSITSDFSMID
jgi:hypothetical protein